MALNVDFTQNALSQFQAGREMVGVHPLAGLVQTVMGRLEALQQAHVAQRMRLEQIREEAAARFQYDPEAQLKARLFTGAGAGALSPSDRESAIRHLLGLSKTPEQIETEAAAEERGKRSIGPTPVQEAQTAADLARAERDRQQTLEKSRPLGYVRGFLQGTPTQPSGLRIVKIEQQVANQQ